MLTLSIGSRRALHVASLVAALALPAALGGCESMGSMSSLQSQAMSMLPESVKGQVNGYLTDVNDVTSILSGVKDMPSAANAVPKLQPYVGKLSDSVSQLNSLDSGTIKTIKDAFGPQLSKASEGFSSQVDRISNLGGGPKSALKPVLDQFKLFG